MLIIEDNSVYEIDEECIQKKRVPPECGTAEKMRKSRRIGKKGRSQEEKNDCGCGPAEQV